jgi:hypothetical protein
MFEMLMDKAKTNIRLLDEYVGKPGNENFPQTTNQAIVLILKDMHQAILRLEERMQLFHEGSS